MSGTVETLAKGPVTLQIQGRLLVGTPGPGFTDITAPIARWVRETNCRTGLLVAFCRHTSASLTIQENADPDVRPDLMTSLDRLAPRTAQYRHDLEGPDDMPAHIRTMLTGVSAQIPVHDGRLALGTWQGLYLIEHRDAAHRREILLHFAGS
jgi:secondary thiamine-phosphate synthase enzyme